MQTFSQRRIPQVFSFLCIILLGRCLFGQTPSLILASGVASPGGPVSLALSLNASPGSSPASLQWTLQFATGDVSAVSSLADVGLNVAGKALSCASSNGSLTCVAWGVNNNTIGNGVVATVAVTLAAQTSGPSVALGLSGTLGAGPDGSAIALSGTGSAITVQGWTVPGGTLPPTAPTNVSAGAAGMNQINLGWTASTDIVGVTGYLVERCQGAGCTAFTQIATPATTNYSDTGLSAGTSYSYRVRATDAAGNLSPYSNVASATTAPATQSPSAPTNLTASPAGTTQINVAWAASTDSVGVTGYLVERCQGAGCTTFTQIATSISITYNDTGLNPGTSYSYRVRATDAAGNLSLYSNVVSAATAQPPTVISAAPAAGYGFSQTFAVTVADSSGPSNLSIVYFLVNSALSDPGSCYVQFNSATNTFRLLNDAGTDWLGSVTLGTAASLANSQCTINAAGASSSSSGNNLTVNVPLSFAAAFAGAQNTYALAYDNASVGSGWLTTGTWTVPGSGPATVAVAPASGSGSSQTFSVTVPASSGLININLVYFIVDSALSSQGSCFAVFNTLTNTFSLFNDIGTEWLGSITPGTATSLSNSQCTINAAAGSSSYSDNTLTVNFPLTFASAFAGPKNTFTLAWVSTFVGSGWLTTGTWTVPSLGPPAVIPSSGSGFSQTFAVTVADSSGPSNLSTIYFLVNSALDGPSSCYVEFNSAANTFRLLNDAGTDWLGPIILGTATSVANSQCTINAATGSSSFSGNNLTVNIPLSFAAAFIGTQNTYAFAYDNASVGSGWMIAGTWTIP